MGLYLFKEEADSCALCSKITLWGEMNVCEGGECCGGSSLHGNMLYCVFSVFFSYLQNGWFLEIHAGKARFPELTGFCVAKLKV